MEKKFLMVDGSNIYYEDSLIGQDILVCVHGFISSSLCWHPILNQLKASFRVICLDLPGFGRTVASENYRYTLSNHGKTVIRLLDKLDLKRVHIVGHSLGGQIALQAIKQKPELFQKVFLIAASATRKRPQWLARLFCYLPFMDQAVYRFYFQEEMVHIAVSKVLSGGVGLEENILQPYVEMCKRPEVIQAILKLGKEREDDMKEEELKQIMHETYLLWGREDQVVSLKEGLFLKSKLPKSTLTVIEHCGHLPMEEYPLTVLHHIYSFFKPNYFNRPRIP